jgi:hypothetical protein
MMACMTLGTSALSVSCCELVLSVVQYKMYPIACSDKSLAHSCGVMSRLSGCTKWSTKVWVSPWLPIVREWSMS